MRSAAAPTASQADLIAWRMHALGLWAPITDAASEHASTGAAGITEVAKHFLALQGQDWGASRWALGVRAPGSTVGDVRAAFDTGQLVRSWPMRGTIHVVPARDIGWIQSITNHRVLPGAAKRRAYLGIDDSTLHRLTDIALEQLAGGRSLSRDELGQAWSAAGIDTPGAWRYHVVWWLCQNGWLTQGPTSNAEPRLVLTEDWITEPRMLSGDEALAELARSFARGRGPVTDNDFAWWTGLTVTEARRGHAIANDAGLLSTIEVEGTRYWAEPGLLDEPRESPADATESALLLPGFDEHLLGYTDRSAVLDAQYFERIVPGRNGMFRATVVEHGRVTGVWTKHAKSKVTRLTIEPFPDRVGDSAQLEQRLAAAATAWSAFHEVAAELLVEA